MYKGELDIALEYLEKSKDITINAFGENHHSLVIALNNIGLIHD